MKNPKNITIGVLAKAASVGVETIQFYERKDILCQPAKIGGFRYYSAEDVRIVQLVKRLQGVGFSLDEIKEFLVFDGCCAQSRQVVKQKSLSKIAEINQKIADLQGAMKALEKFSNTCGADTNTSTCDLLDCFENNWECCN